MKYNLYNIRMFFIVTFLRDFAIISPDEIAQIRASDLALLHVVLRRMSFIFGGKGIIEDPHAV